MFEWPIVPLCPAQLQDVNSQDILNDGLYRKCNTYKGGGGYDKFPLIFKNRFGFASKLNEQFVVQVAGCPLNCPYCYVTEAGVHGKSQKVSTATVVDSFRQSGCSVFHLMGGAPAIYLNHWPELLSALNGTVFHSDFVLFEGLYSRKVLEAITAYPNALFAVSIKGADAKEYLTNTATKINMDQLWKNLDAIVDSGLAFYFTFTGMPQDSINKFQNSVLKRYHNDALLNDAFAIELVHYKALDYRS